MKANNGAIPIRRSVWAVFLILASGLVMDGGAGAGARTICYLPYANYQINYTGNPYQSEQVIFLGTVRCAVCDETQNASFQGQIQAQFTQHIESQYKSRLGVRHEWQERIGYWRWDSPEELLGMHQRIAAHYPNVVHVDTFFYNCAGIAQAVLNSGRFRSESGDTARITDLGGGRYRIEAWQGQAETPTTNLWYNSGVGQMGSDGLIHCVHESVAGYVNPHIVTESYWQIVDPLTIKQVKYRLYAYDAKPASQDFGWREGPTWRFER